MLSHLGLEFLGMEMRNPEDRRRFASNYPGPDACFSLATWHQFETGHPEVFSDTYRIWVRKAPLVALP
jgi:hypothetical protein